MIQFIVAPLLVLATAAGAQECVYKDVMTDADIEACRHPGAKSVEQKPVTRSQLVGSPYGRSTASGTTKSPEQIAADNAAYEAQVAAANAKVAQQKALRSPPEMPRIGMTIDEAETMVNMNWKKTPTSKFSYYKTRNKRTNSSGEHEQWVCDDLLSGPHNYMYFDNGVLTSFSEG